MYLCISAFFPSSLYSQQLKIFESQNQLRQRKNWVHEIPTIKKFGFTKYPREKFWIHELPIRKNFEPTKYQRRHVTQETQHTYFQLCISSNFIYIQLFLSLHLTFIFPSQYFICFFLSAIFNAIFNTTLLSISFSICFILAILLNVK